MERGGNPLNRKFRCLGLLNPPLKYQIVDNMVNKNWESLIFRTPLATLRVFHLPVSLSDSKTCLGFSLPFIFLIVWLLHSSGFFLLPFPPFFGSLIYSAFIKVLNWGLGPHENQIAEMWETWIFFALTQPITRLNCCTISISWEMGSCNICITVWP